MAKTNENVRNDTLVRGDTFVGFRPTVFENAKYDKKKDRRIHLLSFIFFMLLPYLS